MWAPKSGMVRVHSLGDVPLRGPDGRHFASKRLNVARFRKAAIAGVTELETAMAVEPARFLAIVAKGNHAGALHHRQPDAIGRQPATETSRVRGLKAREVFVQRQRLKHADQKARYQVSR